MSVPGWLVLVVERNRVLHTVASAEEALDMLYANWPVTNGRAFFSAMQACAGTAAGTVSQGEAQSAFLAAALDARVVFRTA
ncbi:DUF982 domain-containing protein [Rhizobium cauense]|uniref:DUF982 domain-containing protein n=1 Tax=Rhizobium cauense TaxID=1166683 RepID=UPI0030B91AA1